MMPPRSLLFCADDATLRQLAQVFQDLGLESELCTDIFSALEALTSHDFEIIVVDGSHGAEAVFLLKTAAELKSRKPFTIAISRAGDAPVAGANLVLNPPIVAKSAKLALLTCDEFLGRMRNWLPLPEETEYTGEPKLPESAPTCNSPILQETFASRQVFYERPKPPRTAKSTQKRDLWLLGTAAVVALSFAVYHFRQSQQRTQLVSAVTSPEVIHQVYEEAVQDDTNYLVGDESNHIVVTEIRRSPARRSRGALQLPRTPNVLDGIYDPEIAADEPVATFQPSPTNPTVPESLHSSMPPALIPNSTMAGAPPAVFNNLQPIDLSEDSAERLLIKKVSPPYPLQALKLGVEGPVVFQASIARDGTVQELKLVRGPIALVQAAYGAAKQWRYKPYSPNGEATEARTMLTVEFQRTQLALSH